MGFKNFISGTIGLATLGGIVGAYSASKRIEGVEAVPDAEIGRSFTRFARTRTEAADAMERASNAHDAAGVPPVVLRAFRAPALMPSHHAAVAAFGGHVVKGASYIRSDGVKVTVEDTTRKPPIMPVGALYALQALEGAAPRRRRALGTIFWNTFRISDMYHYVTHCTWDARKVQDDIIAAAAANDKKAVHDLVDHYGHRSMEIEGGLKDIQLFGPEYACAIIERHHTPGRVIETTTEPTQFVGASLQRLVPESAADSAKATPRTVMVDVVYTAPNPYVRAFTSSPYEIQLREWCSDKYGRLLTASVVASLGKL